MKKYIVLVNGGVYGGGDVFDMEGLVKLFDEWSGGEVMEDEDGEVVDIERLIDCGGYGELCEVYNENMVEMGDDFVSVSVVELKIK